MIKAGELRGAGQIRTMGGDLVDLYDAAETGAGLDIREMAWGMGRTLRYGGHIRQDYSVAHHCIVMSHYVPKEYALEALLHDAAEGYIGDVIWPVKVMFPEIEEFENRLLHQIMTKYGADTAGHSADGRYVKSEVVSEADHALLQHECFSFGRPGVYREDVEKAWLHAAAEAHQEWWYAPTYAYLQRFDQLTGSKMLDVEELTKRWFPNDDFSEAHIKEVEEALKAMDDARKAAEE